MKKTKILAVLLIVVLGLGITNSQSAWADANQPINNVQKVKKTKIKIKQGQLKKKTVYTNQKPVFVLDYPKGLKGKTFKYTSSKQKVAQFDENGNLKLRKKGKATVTIKLTAKKSGAVVNYKYKCRLKVKTGVKSIEISSVGNNKFYVGGKYYLKAKVKPAVNSEKIKWRSSNKNVATVSKTGKMKVLSEGAVTITAYSSKTKTKAKFVVNTQQEAGLYFKEGYKVLLNDGQNVQLHPIFVHTPKETIKYTSLDTGMATVTKSGFVKMKRPGMCYIKAETKKWTEYVEINRACKKGMLSVKQLQDAGIDECNKLMIVAHPDDDALWGGAHLMEDGWFVLCLTNNYLEVRRNEFNKMLELSDSKGVILDYPDIYRKRYADKKGAYDKDNWTYVYDGAQIDITKALNYKTWDQIATHSPTGETGHRHHLKINKIATLQSQFLGIYDKLWYFGKFYYKGNPVPSSVPKIDQEHLDFKNKLINVYQNEMTSIKLYWDQMIPYEDWEKATEYGQK